ncbi:MAG: Small-conductance mechanosensitive channel [Syntrophorhabdus sp. PtaB.Bin047]|jgi:small-conductance mechanosensitive channel|nr:MAG: Small-conductance mechanosensitive channel [Syntrophorhabdus sp. PtaB.Bin047]
MELLSKIYYGNTVQDWLIAVGILIVVFAMLKIIQRIGINRLSKLSLLTHNRIDDLLVGILENTKFFFLLIASAYVASLTITFKPAVTTVSEKVIVLVLILQGGFWASAAVSFGLARNIEKRMGEDASSATTITFLGFVARIILWIIVLLSMLANLGVNITGLITGLGIGGIAVALAVQNILGDLLASLSIVLDKPFVIGDFIVVDSLAGTIEHIGLKTTRVRSLNGEQLVFSNNDLLKSRVRNYGRMSERRIVFKLGVVYQTSLEKLKAIKEIITDIVNNQENTRLDRVHFKEYGDSSLNFEVVYYVTNPEYNVYMDIQERINQDIFRRFEEQGIEFAYPTRTVYVQREGE